MPELTGSVENALFEAGCDDATFSVQNGQLQAEFTRLAESNDEATSTAIQQIRNAQVGATDVAIQSVSASI